GVSGVAVGVDHAVGEGLVGHEGEVAVVGGDAGVEEKAAARLHREGTPVAGRVVGGDGGVDGDVVVGLEDDAGAGVGDVGDAGGGDGDIGSRVVAEKETAGSGSVDRGGIDPPARPA